MKQNFIIFDCDGTLIDSEIIVCNVCSASLAELGYVISPYDFMSRFAGFSSIETWRQLQDELTFPLPQGFNAKIDAKIHDLFEKELQPIKGVKEALSQISGTKAVASSTRLAILKKNLDKTGLTDFFTHNIYSASQTARPKPAPDVYLYALSQLGADIENTIVVEDTITGVKAAKKAGLKVIGFHAYLDKIPAYKEKLTEAGACVVIDSMYSLYLEIENIRNNIK